jgi:hypothetical protein
VTIETYLGTAAFGIKYSTVELSEMIEEFRNHTDKVIIDSASNYPINGVPSDFMFNVKTLKNYDNVNIIVKLGSATNMGNKLNLLNYEYLSNQRDYLINLLGGRVYGVGIHWDDREDENLIKETCNFLYESHKMGLKIILSGIKNLNIYRRVWADNEIPLEYQINLRGNGSTDNICRTINILRDLTYSVKICGYGLMGGIKNQTPNRFKLRDSLNFAINELGIDCIILGASNLAQVREYFKVSQNI